MHHADTAPSSVARHDGGRTVDRFRVALRAYEQRAQSRAAVLALWRTAFAGRPAGSL
jgi:hypothetical protein